VCSFEAQIISASTDPKAWVALWYSSRFLPSLPASRLPRRSRDNRNLDSALPIPFPNEQLLTSTVPSFLPSSSRSIGVDWRELAVEANLEKPALRNNDFFKGMQRPVPQILPKPLFFSRMRAK